MADHEHIPVHLDESPNSPAPSLIVCALCLETLEAVAHHRRPQSVRYVILAELVAS